MKLKSYKLPDIKIPKSKLAKSISMPKEKKIKSGLLSMMKVPQPNKPTAAKNKKLSKYV